MNTSCRRSPIGSLILTLLMTHLAGVLNPTPAAAQEPFYRDESPEVVRLRELYSTAGRVFPQGATPISRLRLSKLVRESAPSPDSIALAEALQIDQPYRVRATAEITTEAYLETDDREEPFADQFLREAPLASFDLTTMTQEGPALHLQFDIQREYRQEIVSNIPYPESGNPFPMENDNVRWGVLYLPISGEEWALEATLGRQPIHVGPSPLGSLGPSRRLPYLDALRINLSIGGLTMTHVVSQLENRAVPGELPPATASDGYNYGISRILFNTHYFEYAFERLRLGIGAWVVLSRPNNYFHLNDYFPVFSWHNAEIEPKNMCFLGDASYALFPGIEPYLQVGFDDLRTGGIGLGDTDVPNIGAYLAGVRYWTQLAGRRAVGFAEVGYTHYLWGNYRDDAALSKAIYRVNVDDGNLAMPLTSPYGPGVIWFACDLSWDAAESLRVALTYEIRSANSRANLFTTAYAEDDSVKNADRDILQHAVLRATWRPLQTLALSAAPGLTTNEDQIRGELQLSAAARFSTGGRK